MPVLNMYSIFRFMHCVKSVQIRTFFWSVFSWTWIEYRDLLSESLYSVRIQKNTGRRNSVFGHFSRIDHVNCLQTFQPFQSSSSQVKMVNQFKLHAIFQDTEHQFQENILFHFLHYILLLNFFFIFKGISDPIQIIYWKLWQHCPTKYIIYIPILKIWQFLIFIMIFLVFGISFCTSINRVTYSSSNTSFYH